MEERIHGLSLEDCAAIMAKHSALQAQYGEPAFKPHFLQFLASRNTDENTWAHAWNGWHTRMESDPSGQLYGHFSTLQRKYVAAAHTADIPDASQQEKAGVSLEKYAKIMAEIAGGGDASMILAKNGILAEAQWQQAQAEWNAAMAADVNHHLTTQYGELYAKHSPGFQQKIEAQTAGIMADHYAERAAGIDDEPEKEYTFDEMVQEMQSPKPQTRWTAAHHVCNAWDVGERNDPALDSAARRAYNLCLECCEQHNEFTVSEAEASAEDLKMFAAEGFLTPEQASDAEGAIGRCLGRGREQLATLQAAFAPIANKAVPERVKMQSQIQDYTSLVETLSEILEEWNDNYSAPSASPAMPSFGGGAPSAPTGIQPANGGGDGGILELLKSLPVIGNILRMLGL